MAKLSRPLPRLSVALAAGTLAFASTPMVSAAGEDRLPPAAAGSIVVEDLGANIDLRPSGLPVVPEPPEQLEFDPEREREVLRARVQMELDTDPDVDSARVLVHVTALGRVRLTGVVADENQKIVAEAVAAAVQGVTGVDNNLRVEDGTD